VTVTYLYPNTGTTPPTAAQMLLQNLLTVQVNLLDADTLGALTHNWGLSAAETAFYRPVIVPVAIARETAGDYLTWSLPASSANALTFNKTSGSGSGGTYIFDILRPHTLIQ
jgi:hypothetical protein